MDSFEHVIASILQRQGYWTLTCVKIDLTKEEKREIGRHSSPRWELDVVAYRGRDNKLLVFECKSFLNSPGVQVEAFKNKNSSAAKRYKLFCEETLRDVVLKCCLARQFVEAGFCRPKPNIKLCLAAGKIHGDKDWLGKHFEQNDWVLWGPEYIREQLESLRDTAYENSVATVVAKLLLKESKSHSTKPVGVTADV